MYSDLDSFTKEELLNLFQAKACCKYTLGVARRIWQKLRVYLTDKQRDHLFESWDHYLTCRCGRREFDITCSEIRSCWVGVATLPQSCEERWPILK